MFLFDRDALRQPNEAAFVREGNVRFQDVDAAGIVFFSRVLDYCHDLLVAFYAQAGAPLDQVLRDRTFLAPIRYAQAEYRKPIRFGDRLEVALVRAHVEPTEVTLGFRVARIPGREACVYAQTVLTFLDPTSFQRREVPEVLKSAFAALGE